ncbi:hypothetical protein HDK77DRAFT_432348 [Phyllosticta capitalensis]
MLPICALTNVHRRTAQLFRRRPAARLSAAAVAATATTTTPPPPPPPQLARAPLHDGNGPFGARFYGLAVRCAGVMVGVVVGSGPDKPDWRQSTTAASPSAFDRHVPQRRHPDIGLLGPVGGVIWRAALQIDWYQRVVGNPLGLGQRSLLALVLVLVAFCSGASVFASHDFRQAVQIIWRSPRGALIFACRDF